MSKIRINDLARELEVKSKAILDVLTEVGVTEKKTHSSSLEDFEADKVRAVLQGSGNGQSAKSSRAARPDADGVMPKIDLSHISKPGDVLKAILAKQQGTATAPSAPPQRPVAPPAQETKPAVPAVKPPAPSAPAASAPPRVIAPAAPQKPAAPVASAPPIPAPTAPPAARTPSAPVASSAQPAAQSQSPSTPAQPQ